MRIVIDDNGDSNSTAQVVSTVGQSSGALASVVQVNAGAAPGAGGAGGGSDSATTPSGTVVNAGQAPVPTKQPSTSKK